MLFKEGETESREEEEDINSCWMTSRKREDARI
jgi:hypothetical protein